MHNQKIEMLKDKCENVVRTSENMAIKYQELFEEHQKVKQ